MEPDLVEKNVTPTFAKMILATNKAWWWYTLQSKM